MEYAQDEDMFFHSANMLYQISLNFNTLNKKAELITMSKQLMCYRFLKIAVFVPFFSYIP